jgi:hypothetical protein
MHRNHGVQLLYPIAFALLLTVSGQAAAQDMADGEALYVTATSTPFEGPDGATLGQLTLATKVTAIEDQGDATLVELVGWSMEAGPSVVFYSQDKRIQVATLTEEGQAAREILETMEDEFGTTYAQVRVRGTVASADLAATPEDIWAAGRDVSASACGGCHTVHPPEDFTANQWPGTISSMVPSFVSLPDDELELLTKYLQYHAKDME